jgi:hypothetical protein
MLAEFLKRLHRLFLQEDGQVAILVGLSMTALMVMLGLVLDGGLLFFDERRAQNAADAAALAGAKLRFDRTDATTYSSFSERCNNTAVRAVRPAFNAACAMAESYGFVDTGGNPEVRVNIPPKSPPSNLPASALSSTNNVQVIIYRSRPTTFMKLVGFNTMSVGVQAVAGQQVGEPVGVLYALSDSACPGFDRSGSGNLGIFGGSILVKADCVGAFSKSGTGQICVDAHLDYEDHNDDNNGNGIPREPGEVTPTTWAFSNCSGDGDITIDGTATCPASGCNSRPDLLASDEQVDQILDPLQSLPGPDTGPSPTPDPEAERDPDGSGPHPPQEAFTFCDDDGDGVIDSAIPRSLLAADPRTQATLKPASGNGNCGQLGPGIIPTSPLLLGFADAQNPDRYNACNAPDDPDGPGGIAPNGIPSLVPGIYWGGIEATNCNVEFLPGVYILAGRRGNNTESLLLHMTSSGSVTTPMEDIDEDGHKEGVLIFVTRDDAASSPNRRSSGNVDLRTGGSGSIEMRAGDPPVCPATGPTFAGLFLFVHRGAPLVDSTSGPDNNNQTFINGGGVRTVFQGSFYNRQGRFRANGSFQILDAEIIYNVLDFQIQGDVIITAQCGGPAASFLALLE